MDKKVKNNFANLSLLLISIIFSVFVAEIGLRIVLPKITDESFSIKKGDKLLIPDNEISHILHPSEEFGLDYNGFKNNSVLDKYDIVAMGDSHTYGMLNGVSWVDSLEEKTQKDIYNMGVWGYGFAQYYHLIDKALSFNPKLVIIGLFMGNDIYDAYNVVYGYDGWSEFRSDKFDNSKLISVADHGKQDVLFSSLRLFIRDNSVLYKFTSDRTRIFREKLGLAKPYYIGTDDWTNIDTGASLIYDDEKSIKTFFRNGERVKGVDLEDKNTIEGLRLTKLFLSRINKKVKDADSELLVVFIPTKQSVYFDKIGQKGEDNFLFSKIVKNEKNIKNDLSDFATEENFYVVDILPSLQESVNSGVRLYPDSIDDHPNIDGYRKYSEAIESIVMSLIERNN